MCCCEIFFYMFALKHNYQHVTFQCILYIYIYFQSEQLFTHQNTYRMNLISLPTLRHNQLQSVCENSIKICAGITELDGILSHVTNAFQPFKNGMIKVQASGSSKKEIDTERDNLTTGFLRAIAAEQQFPHTDSATIESLKNLATKANKYSMKITRLPFNEETAAIDNFMADIKPLDLTPLNNSGLTRWIPLIETANKAFKEAAVLYIKDSAQSHTIASATDTAPALIDALEGLYAMLFALIKVNANATHIKSYLQLQTLVDSYR